MFNIRSFMNTNTYNQEQVNLTNEFIVLWLQHVYLTRLFLISSINNLNDIEAVTNRLLRNPKNFAMVFKKYYGGETATIFENLLTEHLVRAAELVEAAKAGDTNTANEIRRKMV